MASLAPFPGNLSLGDRSFANILDDYFNDNWLSGGHPFSDSFKIDVRENERAYTVDAEMPGVKKEEISLSLHGGQLVIDVTRDEKTQGEERDTQYIHQERRYASMTRSIYLAGAVNDGVTASLHDGVLQIIVPKAEKSRTHQYIEIK